jgi:hypothetical protein
MQVGPESTNSEMRARTDRISGTRNVGSRELASEPKRRPVSSDSLIIGGWIDRSIPDLVTSVYLLKGKCAMRNVKRDAKSKLVMA